MSPAGKVNFMMLIHFSICFICFSQDAPFMLKIINLFPNGPWKCCCGNMVHVAELEAGVCSFTEGSKPGFTSLGMERECTGTRMQ